MENQGIPNGWEKNIEDQIDAMKLSGNFQNFLSHLDGTFGSAQKFATYLRLDLQKRLNQCGLGNAMVASPNAWRIDPMKEPRLIADDARHLYTELYRKRIDDGIANHRAFYHAQSPSP